MVLLPFFNKKGLVPKKYKPPSLKIFN